MNQLQERRLNSREQHTWRLLLSVLVLLLDRLDRDLERGAGLSHATYAVLANLSEAPGRALRLSELAAILWTSRTRVTYLIDQLEKVGWLRRQAAPGDRRGTLAVLTDAGFGALQRAVPVHVESVRRRIFDHLEAGQVDELGNICQALLPHLTEPGMSQIIDALRETEAPSSDA